MAFEARWIGGPGRLRATTPWGRSDILSLADLAAGYEWVKAMRPVPLTKESLVPLVLAALTPLAAVALTQAPVAKVLGEIKGLLLF